MDTVLRQLRWAEMDEDARAALCGRGLGDIFDPELRRSIAALIDDVRDRGDVAVCDALPASTASAEPHQLRVTADELAGAEVSAARRRRAR